jgi:mono/diheme cytochrome c family protein
MGRLFVPHVGLMSVVALAAAIAGFAVSPAQAQSDPAPTGAYLFRTYCASCHGTSAQGDGPLASAMRRKPANLTEILKRNAGVFPSEMVFRIIDGRTKVAGHGGPDMPVWGDVFRRSVDGADPAAVKARIDALVAFLETIQVRAGDVHDRSGQLKADYEGRSSANFSMR